MLHPTPLSAASVTDPLSGSQIPLTIGVDGTSFAGSISVSQDGPVGLSMNFTDLVGNTTAVVLSGNTRTSPPQITSLAPQSGFQSTTRTLAINATSDEPLASATVNGTQLTLTSGGLAVADFYTVQTDGPVHLDLVFIDKAGNVAHTVSDGAIDSTPPILMITSPANGFALFGDSVTVTGTSNEPLAAVSASGNPLNLSSDGLSFWGQLTLPLGPTTISISGSDLFGNVTTVPISGALNPITPPIITLGVPQHIITNQAAFVVPITTSDAEGSAVQISILLNGALALEFSGVPGITGNFTANLTLNEGKNSLTVRAVDSAGLTSTVALTDITLNTRAPVISTSIASPLSQAGPNIFIPFSVMDAVPTQTSVFQNGQQILSTTNPFFSIFANLTPGLNVFTVTSQDAAGNIAEPFSVSVTQNFLTLSYPSPGQTISGQSVPIAGETQIPLVSANVNGSALITAGPFLFGDYVPASTGSQQLTITAADGTGGVVTTNVAINYLGVVVATGGTGGAVQNVALAITSITPAVDTSVNTQLVPISLTTNKPISFASVNGQSLVVSPNQLSAYGSVFGSAAGAIGLHFDVATSTGETASIDSRVTVSLPTADITAGFVIDSATVATSGTQQASATVTGRASGLNFVSGQTIQVETDRGVESIPVTTAIPAGAFFTWQNQTANSGLRYFAFEPMTGSFTARLDSSLSRIHNPFRIAIRSGAFSGCSMAIESESPNGWNFQAPGQRQEPCHLTHAPEVDSVGLFVGDNTQLTFTVKIDPGSQPDDGTFHLVSVDETFIPYGSNLCIPVDNGSSANGDVTAGDGIYSCIATISPTQTGNLRLVVSSQYSGVQIVSPELVLPVATHKITNAVFQRISSNQQSVTSSLVQNLSSTSNVMSALSATVSSAMTVPGVLSASILPDGSLQVVHDPGIIFVVPTKFYGQVDTVAKASPLERRQQDGLYGFASTCQNLPESTTASPSIREQARTLDLTQFLWNFWEQTANAAVVSASNLISSDKVLIWDPFHSDFIAKGIGSIDHSQDVANLFSFRLSGCPNFKTPEVVQDDAATPFSLRKMADAGTIFLNSHGGFYTRFDPGTSQQISEQYILTGQKVTMGDAIGAAVTAAYETKFLDGFFTLQQPPMTQVQLQQNLFSDWFIGVSGQFLDSTVTADLSHSVIYNASCANGAPGSIRNFFTGLSGGTPAGAYLAYDDDVRVQFSNETAVQFFEKMLDNAHSARLAREDVASLELAGGQPAFVDPGVGFNSARCPGPGYLCALHAHWVLLGNDVELSYPTQPILEFQQVSDPMVLDFPKDLGAGKTVSFSVKNLTACDLNSGEVVTDSWITGPGQITVLGFQSQELDLGIDTRQFLTDESITEIRSGLVAIYSPANVPACPLRGSALDLVLAEQSSSGWTPVNVTAVSHVPVADIDQVVDFGYLPAGSAGGQQRTFTIKNNGEAPMHWRAWSDQTWIQISPSSGTVGPSGDKVVPTVTLAGEANGFAGSFGARVFVESTEGDDREVSVGGILETENCYPSPRVFLAPGPHSRVSTNDDVFVSALFVGDCAGQFSFDSSNIIFGDSGGETLAFGQHVYSASGNYTVNGSARILSNKGGSLTLPLPPVSVEVYDPSLGVSPTSGTLSMASLVGTGSNLSAPVTFSITNHATVPQFYTVESLFSEGQFEGIAIFPAFGLIPPGGSIDVNVSYNSSFAPPCGGDTPGIVPLQVGGDLGGDDVPLNISLSGQ